MKNYVKADGSIWAFEGDGSQDELITPDMTPISADAVSDLQRAVVPLLVTMRQARLALLSVGKLSGVDAAINSLPSSQRDAARIEWEYASTVERNSALCAMLGAALGFNSQALDALFVSAAKL